MAYQTNWNMLSFKISDCFLLYYIGCIMKLTALYLKCIYSVQHSLWRHCFHCDVITFTGLQNTDRPVLNQAVRYHTTVVIVGSQDVVSEAGSSDCNRLLGRQTWRTTRATQVDSRPSRWGHSSIYTVLYISLRLQ